MISVKSERGHGFCLLTPKTNMMDQGGLSFNQTDDATLVIGLSGAWRLKGKLPTVSEVEHNLGWPLRRTELLLTHKV